jgi:N-acetyl sugar amidotransferase
MKIFNEEVLKSSSEANFGKSYQQCSISLMDTISDPNISFDSKGISNYFHDYLDLEKRFVLKGNSGKQKYSDTINKIKANSKNKKYDCILGVSGGVDSSFLAYLAKCENLRTLCVHFDNGWNSEVAVMNIQKIIKICGFDLYTYVIDWEEFKDLQLSYLKAGVIDIEVLTDHAIITTLYRIAFKFNIKYVLSGYNIASEATLPKSWVWNKTDHINILDIHKLHGSIPLRKFPVFGFFEKQLYIKLKKIEFVTLLNFCNYQKSHVKTILSNEFNWVDYGGKHHESIFTRFFQNYILPVKFGVDKRKAHLSNLIFSGQLTKSEALIEISKPIYQPEDLKKDYEFVLKKLGLKNYEFDNYIDSAPKRHQDFKVELSIREKYFLKTSKFFRR